jgi:hypothetical protein
VRYDEKIYPGRVVSIDSSAAEVDCMEPYGKSLLTWRWPTKRDRLCYLRHDVIKPIKEPCKIPEKSTDRCRVFNVPEIADYK